jgi:hypothetical protein
VELRSCLVCLEWVYVSVMFSIKRKLEMQLLAVFLNEFWEPLLMNL